MTTTLEVTVADTAANTSGESQADSAATNDQNTAAQDDSTQTQDDSTTQQNQQGTNESQSDDTSQGDTSKAQDKAADDSHDDDSDAEDADDDLSTDELDKLDAKVRAKLSKKNREAANLRSRLTSETTRADRAEVALAAGLPADAMKFLNGASREELETNATDLLAMLGMQGRVAPEGLPQEQGLAGTASVNKVPDLDAIGSRMYER